MSAPFAYDAFEYPTVPMRQCHPDRLYVVGRLFGLTPQRIETCRGLDVGCGTGTHLIAAGLALPDARFVGLDLSGEAIRQGQVLAAEAGVTNVELRQADLMDFRPERGSFDYLTAHGFYSWVPAPVRDRLLAVAAEALTANGLGYVSYNAYPGCHIRQMFWGMMRFHIPDGAGPGEKVEQVRTLAEFLVAGQAEQSDDVPARIIRKETDRLITRAHPGSIYHDDLAPINDPVYVSDFAGDLSRHGLRFVAEADVFTMHEGAFPPGVAAVLEQMREKDLVLKEQYIDFLLLRRFRQSVFARAASRAATAPQPAVVAEFAIGLTDRLIPEHTDLSLGKPLTFRSSGERGTMTVDHPLAKAALLELVGQWPGRIWIAELVGRAADRVGMKVGETHRAGLARALLAAHLNGPVEFFCHVPRAAAVPGTRPVASPLARAQARRGNKVATLFHTTIDLESEVNRRLLMLLDGSRDRAALAVELRAQDADLPAGPELDGRIETMLNRLAELGLLVGGEGR
jgi:SAM-dependent methyltransferase